MDYVTRQFINLTKRFRKESRKALELVQREIQKHTEAISAANKSNHQQDEVWQKRFNEVFSEYKHAERNKTTNDYRSYRVQNSIRWATWLAFGAAAIYAAISYCQWRTAHQALIEARDSSDKQYGKLAEQITALETANSIAVAANRPWIGSSQYTDPRDAPTLIRNHDEKGEFIQLMYVWVFKNVGKRPAHIVNIRTTGHSYKVCSENPHYSNAPFSRAFLIPETTIKSLLAMPIPLDEWRKIQDTNPATGMQYCIYSLIEYEDVNAPTHVHTTRDCRFFIQASTMKDPSFGECANNYAGAD
jgi:hypothetical protein